MYRRRSDFDVTMRPGRARLAAVCAWMTAVAVLTMVAPLATPAVAAARGAALIVDANTGRVLHSEDADAPRFPASLTKVMTLYLVFEAIRDGRLSYATKIKISEHAASQPPSNLDLSEGDEIRVGDAIKVLITKSANDVAAAVAEHIGGSERKFAELMTRRARAIGMKATTFRNASGLPDNEQITTARDMVTLGLRLQDDFPVEYKMFQTERFTYAGRSYANHNTLLRGYEGIDGIKTGYTRASGFNLLSSARRNGRHLVGAVFGGATAGLRNQRMRFLLASSMRRASTTRTRALPPQLIAKPRAAPRPTRLALAAPVATKPARSAAVPVAPPRKELRSPASNLASLPPSKAATPALVHDGPSITVARVKPTSVLASAQPKPLARPLEADVGRMTFAAPSMNPGVRPPSTLGAQAASLAGATGAPPPAAAPPVALPAPSALGGPPHGDFHIQIGAYASAAEAERSMAAARNRAAGLLDRAAAVTVPIGAGGKPMYRARFAGFDAKAATATCLELRRKAIDCFVARAQ